MKGDRTHQRNPLRHSNLRSHCRRHTDTRQGCTATFAGIQTHRPYNGFLPELKSTNSKSQSEQKQCNEHSQFTANAIMQRTFKIPVQFRNWLGFRKTVIHSLHWSSSEPSGQSTSWSHFHEDEMHVPSEHSNSSSEHVRSAEKNKCMTTCEKCEHTTTEKSPSQGI